MRRLLCLLLALMAAIATRAETRVIDGDTLRVDGVDMRLWGVDAPERRQTCRNEGGDYACGERAADYLLGLLAGHAVSCEPRGHDRYRRTIALCRADGRDLGADMVQSGWALAYVRYSADYLGEEKQARDARRGLWAGSFVAPWEWRAARRRG